MLPSTLRAGTVFGQDFEILQRLAQGGMGTVYVAMQHSTGKKRALKVMHAQYEGDEHARKRFIQEAKAGASIDSDHIVEMVGAGIDPETNTPWIAMELLKGDDLKMVLGTRKRLPPGEVLEIFRQICHALGKAHKMGLVHRDLKPENIFLATPRREGIAFTAKILDFGIAKLVRDSTGASNGTQTQAIGSPRWMSPEQADRGNAPISPATDVWALGLLAFNLLTGEVFWKTAHSENPSVISQMCEILMDPIAPASERAAEFGVAQYLPAAFDEWFDRCVNRDVGARYADADAALAEFEPIFADVEPVAVARVSRSSTPVRGVSSMRPPPVPAAPAGYTLELPTGRDDQAFSLDRTGLAESAAPKRSLTPAPIPASILPPKRRLGPILLAVLGPLGIAAAVLIGIQQNSHTADPASDRDAAAAPVDAIAAPPADHDASTLSNGADVLSEAVVQVLVPEPIPPVVDVPPTAHPDLAARHDSGRAPHNPGHPAAESDAGEALPSGAEMSTTQYTQHVLAQLRTHYPEFVHCYEEHNPAAASGTHISLHFSIRADGVPQGVGVSGPPEVGNCISDVIRGMTLPTPVTVTGPIFHDLHFQSSQTETEPPPAQTAPAPTPAPAPAPTPPPP